MRAVAESGSSNCTYW